MFEVSLSTSGFEKLRKKYELAKASVLTELTRAAEETNQNALVEVKGRFSGHSEPGPKALTSRSGNLENSLYQKTVLNGSDIKVTLGTTAIYGAIQEKGGTITGNPMLGIPIMGGLDATGGAAFKSVREVAVPLFKITSKQGNVLLVAKDGNGILPYFVLKSSVTLQAGRLGLAATLKRNFQGKGSYFDKRFRAAVGRVLK